jgi:ribulose-5-phosphate 4-epimerase/fuculose-1-phosphate aldolase
MPLNQPAVYLAHITGYIEYEFDEDEAFARHFVERLGRNQILISRNHGYYSLGDTAAAAFFRAYFLRQTCAAQIKTLSMGRELHPIDPQKVARYQDQMDASEHYSYDGKTEWPGLLRMLDKSGADYRS